MKNKNYPTVTGRIVTIPRDFHKGNAIEIPGCSRRIFPTSDSRASDENFTVDGVIAIISGKMDHTLSVFFKGHDVIMLKAKNHVEDGKGDRLQFSDGSGKLLLTVYLPALEAYCKLTSSDGISERLKEVIPGYTGRLMYDFENDLLKGGNSFGLLTALAVPFDNQKEGYNGHYVPEFFKILIFSKHI